jgi:hypothetical protein
MSRLQIVSTVPGARNAVNQCRVMTGLRSGHKLSVVPAKAGTHNPRIQFDARGSNKQIAEITPFGIVTLDQFDLPIALPALQLLLIASSARS